MSLGKAFLQIALSDNPEEGLKKLTAEVKEAAKDDLGEYQGKDAPKTLTTTGETVEEPDGTRTP